MARFLMTRPLRIAAKLALAAVLILALMLYAQVTVEFVYTGF